MNLEEDCPSPLLACFAFQVRFAMCQMGAWATLVYRRSFSFVGLELSGVAKRARCAIRVAPIPSCQVFNKRRFRSRLITRGTHSTRDTSEVMHRMESVRGGGVCECVCALCCMHLRGCLVYLSLLVEQWSTTGWKWLEERRATQGLRLVTVKVRQKRLKDAGIESLDWYHRPRDSINAIRWISSLQESCNLSKCRSVEVQ